MQLIVEQIVRQGEGVPENSHLHPLEGGGIFSEPRRRGHAQDLSREGGRQGVEGREAEDFYLEIGAGGKSFGHAKAGVHVALPVGEISVYYYCYSLHDIYTNVVNYIAIFEDRNEVE